MQFPFLNRWHPNLALRYLPTVAQIPKNTTVLEVGSGALGIGPYLKRPFTGIDIDFTGPKWLPMQQVVASAINLPLKRDSFDIVINTDMLEHLPTEKRFLAILDMLRVARKKLIIGVPIGEKAHIQDKKLDKLYYKIHGYRHPFLQEQTDYGLPEKVEMNLAITKAADKLGKRIAITSEPNMNLRLRFWMMKGWISKNAFTNIFFRKILLFAIPILRYFNFEPTYRQIFFVSIV